MQAANQDFAAENQRLQVQLIESKGQIIIYETRIIELTTHNASAERDIEDQVEAIRQLQQDLHERSEQVTALQVNMATVESELATSSNICESLRRDNLDMQRRIDDSMQSKAEMQAYCKDMESKLEQVEEQQQEQDRKSVNASRQYEAEIYDLMMQQRQTVEALQGKEKLVHTLEHEMALMRDSMRVNRQEQA